MRAYEWPKKMVSIMKEATVAANAEHKVGRCRLKPAETRVESEFVS
jgi:hypothetical protein